MQYNKQVSIYKMVGQILRIGCVESPPLAMQCPVGSVEKIRKGNGLSLDLVHFLSGTFLSNYSIEIVDLTKELPKLENGTWNGLVRALINHRINMTMPVFVGYTAKRDNLLSYVFPFLDTYQLAVVFNPVRTVPHMPLFHPFQWPVWLCWFLLYLLLVTMISQILTQNLTNFIGQAYNVTFRQENVGKWPGFVAKFLMTIWALTALVGQKQYKAGYVHWLTKDYQITDLSSLADRISSGEYHLVKGKGYEYAKHLIENQYDHGFEPLRKALRNLDATEELPLKSLWEHIINEPGTTRIVELYVARDYQRRYPHLKVLKLKTDFLYTSIGVLGPNMNRSCLYRHLSKATSYMHECGIWKIITNRYRIPEDSLPKRSAMKSRGSLSALDLAKVFITFACANLACISCLVLEHFYFQINQSSIVLS